MSIKKTKLISETETTETETSHQPNPDFKRFYLKRDKDISGVSGVGYVAEGIQFSNGTCVLYWLGVTSCISMWHSVYEMLKVHGHNGATIIEWVD
jgi:hypothetical protein